MDPFWFYPFLSAFIRVIRVKGMFRLPGKSGGVQGFDFEGGGAGAAGLDGEFDRQDFRVLGHAPEGAVVVDEHGDGRSEEHTSELQSLMRISYAVFCLKKTITKPSTIKTITLM